LLVETNKRSKISIYAIIKLVMYQLLELFFQLNEEQIKSKIISLETSLINHHNIRIAEIIENIILI
jgi:hypothetical protein